jgi:hypothetical protein
MYTPASSNSRAVRGILRGVRSCRVQAVCTESRLWHNVRNIIQAYTIHQHAGWASVQKFQRCRIHTCAESSVGRIYMCRESSVVQNKCASFDVCA